MIALFDDLGYLGDDIPTCRACGCSDFAACSPACWWVPDPEGLGDLCSRCAEALLAARPTSFLRADGDLARMAWGAEPTPGEQGQLDGDLDMIDEASPAEDHEVVAEWSRVLVPS